MIKQLDWALKESLAKKMSIRQLEYAIQDCLDCKMDEGYYHDEASVYRAELKRRFKCQ